MSKKKKKKPQVFVVDEVKLAEFESVTKLAHKYWGDTTGMFHKLPDGAWGVNTNGFEVERLGTTLEEVEQYMQDHPRTKEGELKKFEEMLLKQAKQFGIDLKL